MKKIKLGVKKIAIIWIFIVILSVISYLSDSFGIEWLRYVTIVIFSLSALFIVLGFLYGVFQIIKLGKDGSYNNY